MFFLVILFCNDYFHEFQTLRLSQKSQAVFLAFGTLTFRSDLSKAVSAALASYVVDFDSIFNYRFVVLIWLTYFVEITYTHISFALAMTSEEMHFLSNWLEVEVGQPHDAKELHSINVARLCLLRPFPHSRFGHFQCPKRKSKTTSEYKYTPN